MQNKPNFRKAAMNVNSLIAMDYENFIPLAGYKNKPKTNPISSKSKMNVSLYFIEDYSKNDVFLVRINKPNFRNGQNERKYLYHKGL